MKILVVSGSPKSNGNTLKIAKMVENEISLMNSKIEFEYLHLNKVNLKNCIGCYQCLDLGQDKCPLKDDQKEIERKMVLADSVIFLSPVYVANVSGMFKNFIDRFAYICHRPVFHGKKAVVISSTGAMAHSIVNIIMKYSIEIWGFEVVSKIGGVVSPNISVEESDKQWKVINKKVKNESKKYYEKLTSKKKPKAKAAKIYAFVLQKNSFMKASKDKIDYKYWKENGWLDRSSKYYTEASINPIVYWMMAIIAKFNLKKLPTK